MTPADSCDICDICERTGARAARCAFGHPSGCCSCWRSIPCDGRTGKPLAEVKPLLFPLAYTSRQGTLELGGAK